MSLASSAKPADAPDEIVARLRAAVRRRFGGGAELDNIVVATLGGSNRTLLFDLVERNARRRLVFRQETYRLAHSPFIAPHAQFIGHLTGHWLTAFRCDAQEVSSRRYRRQSDRAPT